VAGEYVRLGHRRNQQFTQGAPLVDVEVVIPWVISANVPGSDELALGNGKCSNSPLAAQVDMILLAFDCPAV
jgi:hypothetical protein